MNTLSHFSSRQLREELNRRNAQVFEIKNKIDSLVSKRQANTHELEIISAQIKDLEAKLKEITGE